MSNKTHKTVLLHAAKETLEKNINGTTCTISLKEYLEIMSALQLAIIEMDELEEIKEFTQDVIGQLSKKISWR